MADNVTAQGDRSVAVGCDVINSIITTGDHNRFFIGDYERLRDAYIKPWPVFERVNLARFVGREWLLAEVDAFLRDHDRGYFVLEAEAGLGKTAFLAWLVKQHGYVHHFVELAPGQEGVGVGLKNLGAQLVLAYHLAAWEAEGVLPAAAARPDYLARLLKLAAEQRQDGEKVVLVVDALDEAGTPMRQNVLGLPNVLPEGVYVIASQRPVAVTLQVDTASTARRVFRLAAGSDENQADMRRYLQGAVAWPGVAKALRAGGYSADQFVETLLGKCRGVWIYLHYVVHEIERGQRLPLDLNGLPDGMTQYYARYWRSWRDANEAMWYESYLPLLATLAAAREAVSVERLVAWSGVTMALPRLRRLLNERWRPFLAVSDVDGETRYRFFHATLVEFFSGQVEREKLSEAELALVDESTRFAVAAHSNIVGHFMQREASERSQDQYALRHLCYHLIEVEAMSSFYDLVLSREWWRAKRGHTRYGNTYIQDVTSLVALVEQQIEQELALCRSENQNSFSERLAVPLSQVFALSHAMGMEKGTANSVPIEAICGLADLGDVQLALAYADAMDDYHERTGFDLFLSHVPGMGRAVFRSSVKAEVYRRIGMTCLYRSSGEMINPRESGTSIFLDLATSSLKMAAELVDRRGEPEDVERLLPDLAKANMKEYVERLRAKYHVNIHNEAYFDSRINADDDNWEERGKVIDEAVGYSDAGIAAEAVLGTCRNDYWENWIEYLPPVQLVYAGKLLASARRTDIAFAILEKVRTATHEYLDQKARAIALAVEALAPALDAKSVAGFIEESRELVCANPREDFRVVGQGVLAVVMNRLDMQDQAHDLLRKAMVEAYTIPYAQDRDFALEGLARAVTTIGDYGLMRIMLEGVNGRIAYKRRHYDNSTKAIRSALSSVNAFRDPLEVLGSPWTKEEVLVFGQDVTIRTLVREIVDTGNLAPAIRVSNILDEDHVRITVFCNLILILHSDGHNRLAGRMLGQVVKQYCASVVANGISHEVKYAFETIIDCASQILSPDNLVKLGQLATKVKDSDQKVEVLSQIISRLLVVDPKAIDSARRLAAKMPRGKDRVGAWTEMTLVAHQNGSAGQIKRLLDRARSEAVKLNQQDIRAASLAKVATAMTHCGDVAGSEQMIREVFSVFDHSAAENHLQPRNEGLSLRATWALECGPILCDCLRLLGGEHSKSLVQRAIGLVRKQNDPLDRARLTTVLADRLVAMGQNSRATELLDETRYPIRDALDQQRRLHSDNAHRWRPLDDAYYALRVAAAMEELADAGGLVILASQTAYREQSEWLEKGHFESDLSFAEKESMGYVVAALIKTGRSAQARSLLSQAASDEYQAEGIARVVRDLVEVEERYEIDWLLDAANRITEPLYVEYAQRMVTWLMVHYQNEAKAWNAAHNALVGIEQLFQRGSRVLTYLCVADLVNMLLRQESLRVIAAVDLMLQSLRLARMVGGQDSWDVIGAMFPLLTRVGGRSAAERVWLEIERVDTMHGLSPRIERGSYLHGVHLN